jgi:hypothetical protein
VGDDRARPLPRPPPHAGPGGQTSVSVMDHWLSH